MQEEEDSQFEIIQKLEREEGKHRELAEQARKEASRVDGEKGSAEAEKRRGEAEVRSPRFDVLRCLHFVDVTRIMLWVVSFPL